jgi:NAD(P)-dependent dehydrogenase (short-subunit alcohol dehydrogenase family)
MTQHPARRILVVGGSSGIGLAVARLLHASGDQVVIASRSRERIEKAKIALGPECVGVTIDVENDDAVERFFQDNGDFGHVVVSAATIRIGSVRSIPISDAMRAMNSKFWGAYRVARFARLRPAGSLTFVGGYRSIRPTRETAILSAINAGIEGLARGLAMEFAPSVRVNVVSPGFVDTPLWGEKTAEQRDAFLAKMTAGIPLGIAGQAEHIAMQIKACIDNPYMTGSTILVDGGAALA